MNIPTKVFMESRISEFYENHGGFNRFRTMFGIGEKVAIDLLTEGEHQDFSIEEIAQNKCRYDNPEDVKNAMKWMFEDDWICEGEFGHAFMEHCRTLGHTFVNPGEGDIDWEVVMEALNKSLSDLPEETIKIAKGELAYRERKRQEIQEYYMKMSMDERKPAVETKVKELEGRIDELKSFIK